MVERYLIVGAGGARLATTYQTFDGTDVGRVDVAVFLVLQIGLNLLILVLDNLVGLVAKELVETVDEVHEACHLLIANSNVSAGFVGDMHVVALLYESSNGATHGDDIVVGVWGEDDDLLGERLCTLRTIGVVGIGLATGPARDGVLQVVEDLDVGIVGRTIECQQFRQAVLIVVLVGEFQNGLLCHLTQPDQGRTYQFVIPGAAGDEPGVYDTGETCCCRQVDDHLCVVVCLQERGRDGIGDVALYRLLDDGSFLFAPCCEENLPCRQDGVDTHRDGAGWHCLAIAKAHGHLFARGGIDEDEARGAVES